MQSSGFSGVASVNVPKDYAHHPLSLKADTVHLQTPVKLCDTVTRFLASGRGHDVDPSSALFICQRKRLYLKCNQSLPDDPSLLSQLRWRRRGQRGNQKVLLQSRSERRPGTDINAKMIVSTLFACMTATLKPPACVAPPVCSSMGSCASSWSP